MAIYVDKENIPWRGKSWCHLYADSPRELHMIAKRLGLKQEWFQDPRQGKNWPHYDIVTNKRPRAIQLGAILQDRKAFVVTAKRIQTNYWRGKWI